MKSHELSLIRAEGLDIENLQFSIHMDQECYGSLELKQGNHQHSLYLPVTGNLCLKAKKNSVEIGRTLVDIMLLEQDGLQWLPVLEVDSKPILAMPEEVPAPRILISLYSSRTKTPNFPISQKSEEKIPSPKALTPSEFIEKIPENLKSDSQNPIKEATKPSSFRRTEREKTLKMTTENIYEDIIEQLKQDLDKSQKKNFLNKKKKRELRLEVRILNEKIIKLKESGQVELESFNEQISSLEKSLRESSKEQEDLQEVVEGFMESSLNLEKILKQTNEEKNKLGEILETCLREKAELESKVKGDENCDRVCEACDKHQCEIKGHLENTKRLYQTIQIMTDKLNTQEFHNQELMIVNQELLLEIENLKNMEEGLADSEICCNCLPINEIDELFKSNYPSIYHKSIKVVSGIYIIEQKKVKIQKSEKDKLKFFLDGSEIHLQEKLENIPKHEKNSLSLEEINTNIENLKSQSMIHTRTNLRDNKLRVLAKQW